MSRFLLLPFLFLLCIQLQAQDTLNHTDGRGRRQGAWRKTDSAGRVIYVGHFKDGFPEGEFRYFYPDGKLKTVSVVSRQGKRAVTVSYYSNGVKMAAGNYLNEKKDSTWQFFNEVTGTLVSEEQYRNGLQDGTSKLYFPEGGLAEVRHYKAGKQDGSWEQYHPDGKLKIRGNFRDGEKEGLFRTFYPSGRLMIEGQYIAGHPDGKWTYLDDKGGLIKTDKFDKGLLMSTDEPAKK